MNYCAIGAGSILGKSFRVTLGGSTHQLKDYAAENHMKERLQGNENTSFALRAIENSYFDRKFKNACDSVNKDRDLLRKMTVETKLELFALFQQGHFGDAKPKDFSLVPEQMREWVMQK